MTAPPPNESEVIKTNDDRAEHEPEESPGVLFARKIPVMALKLESRACGLLAAWVRDTVIFVDALSRAEET